MDNKKMKVSEQEGDTINFFTIRSSIMQNADKPADMLAVFDTIVPVKEELITPEDLAACQAYQNQCYDVLDELAAKHQVPVQRSGEIHRQICYHL